MRILAGFALLLLVSWGCGKSNTEPAPVYTTPDGIWTYTTPDNAIKVEFELKTNMGTLEILNTAIEVSGTPGNAAGQLTNVNLPYIERILINANDSGLTYPYSITFMDCGLNSANTFISVANASYIGMSGQVKTLSGVSIGRK
jgi:hypothetical protein